MLWWSDLLNRGDYRNGPQLVRESGLFIENIHTPFQVQNDLWQDNLDGGASVDCYLQCIADCATFEIPTMVVHLPNEDHPHTPLGLDRINQIIENAERLGVQVAMENLRNLSNLSFVLEQVDSPRIGFCYDCTHHYRYCSGEDLLSRYGSRLMALHLHDYEGDAIHRLPFDGVTDWPLTMKKITETGYPGPTAIEAMNWEYKDISPDEFLRRAFERAKRLEELR